MDFITKSVDGATIRKISVVIRRIFGCNSDDEPFPVLDALEIISDVVEGTTYEIVEDDKLPAKVFAHCYPKPNGGFKIEIKQTVYDGAYKDKNPAFLSFIRHELCHIFLFWIGYTPISTRAFGDNEIQPYRSVEWQAKALCGEVMIPFEATAGMTTAEIVNKYNVTKQSADYRRKHLK